MHQRAIKVAVGTHLLGPGGFCTPEVSGQEKHFMSTQWGFIHTFIIITAVMINNDVNKPHVCKTFIPLIHSK